MTNKWTTDNIPDLTGKVIIVTGGNSGLGYESVKAFARNGANVILACRSLKRGKDARNSISGVNGNIDIMQLDLEDFGSVKRLTENFKQKYNRLDVLLNNSGIMATPYFLTKEGLEGQTGTNHFGHFALTGRLMEMIINTPGSRVINVSSIAHKFGNMDFDNLLFENGKGYSPMKAYGRSKLMNLLFTYELQRYFENNDIGSKYVAAHPGVSSTKLFRHLRNTNLFKLIGPAWKLISQKKDMGALPQIRASVDKSVKGGEFYGPNMWLGGYPVKVKSGRASYNPEDARRLWEISEDITGVSID
jgi:NAD(P)-dependent dehydrogenase (short-subunit alcohol dehydrogenase family)